MQIDTTLTIIGIIISIIFGAYGIYFANNKKNNSKVSLICQSIIPIFSTFQERHDNIKIEYSGTPISEKLVYLKFTFVNNGTFDIDKNKMYKPLEIQFPTGYNILECKTFERSTSDIISNLTFEKNIIKLEWDLLKINEYITFELFLDLPKGDDGITDFNISNKLKLSYRISNLSKVDIIDYKNNEPRNPKQMIKSLIIGILMLVIFFFLFGSMLLNGINSFTKPSVKVLGDKIIYFKSKETISDIDLTGTDLVLFKENSKVIDTIPVSDVENSIYLSSKLEISKNQYFILIGSIILCLIYILASWFGISEFFKQIKTNNLFKQLKQ